MKHTMSKISTPNKEAMAPATSAAQHGDNIAHALAGAGGGLLSMTLTQAIPSPAPPVLQC